MLTQDYENEWARAQAVERYLDRRSTALILGKAWTLLGLVYLEQGQRMGRPRFAYRAGGAFLQACNQWQRAGMGRKAAAVSRLADRSRRAWLRYQAAEGLR